MLTATKINKNNLRNIHKLMNLNKNCVHGLKLYKLKD
jgi:hypothetical protein